MPWTVFAFTTEATRIRLSGLSAAKTTRRLSGETIAGPTVGPKDWKVAFSGGSIEERTGASTPLGRPRYPLVVPRVSIAAPNVIAAAHVLQRWNRLFAARLHQERPAALLQQPDLVSKLLHGGIGLCLQTETLKYLAIP